MLYTYHYIGYTIIYKRCALLGFPFSCDFLRVERIGRVYSKRIIFCFLLLKKELGHIKLGTWKPMDPMGLTVHHGIFVVSKSLCQANGLSTGQDSRCEGSHIGCTSQMEHLQKLQTPGPLLSWHQEDPFREFSKIWFNMIQLDSAIKNCKKMWLIEVNLISASGLFCATSHWSTSKLCHSSSFLLQAANTAVPATSTELFSAVLVLSHTWRQIEPRIDWWTWLHLTRQNHLIQQPWLQDTSSVLNTFKYIICFPEKCFRLSTRSFSKYQDVRKEVQSRAPTSEHHGH